MNLARKASGKARGDEEPELGKLSLCVRLLLLFVSCLMSTLTMIDLGLIVQRGVSASAKVSLHSSQEFNSKPASRAPALQRVSYRRLHHHHHHHFQSKRPASGGKSKTNTDYDAPAISAELHLAQSSADFEPSQLGSIASSLRPFVCLFISRLPAASSSGSYLPSIWRHHFC